MQICPNCVVELVKQSKKLGDLSRWYVCPKCGHRERPDNDGMMAKITGQFCERIKRQNKNINQFNQET